jgi:hypothetical protein
LNGWWIWEAGRENRLLCCTEKTILCCDSTGDEHENQGENHT